MSIASEISRLQTAKTDIKTAIEAKGVTVPSSATIDTYDDYVSQITGGGGIPIPSKLSAISLTDYGLITAATIKSGETNINNGAFYGCNTLTSIVIPNSVTSIGEQAFYNCGRLTSVNIPSGVTSINDSVFYGCYNLTSIDIPSGVTSIGNYAFTICRDLTSIDIPSGVTSIGQSAFSSCSGLQSITINAANPPTLSNANAFNNTNNCPIYVPSESVTTYQTTGNWSSLASRIQAIPNS